MQFQQALEVSTQTDSPRESCASKGVGCGAMHAEHIEDTGANMSNVQLQAAERAQQRLERENADLKQQLKSMESRYDSSRQLLEAQATELAEKSRVIEALQSKLSRLSNLAAAFTDEVHGANSVITSAGMPPYQSLAARQAQQQQTAAAASQQKPAVPTATPEQQLNLPAAMAVLTRLHQQQQQHQQNASVVAAAAAAAEAAAAAGVVAATGMRLPSAGSKRGRLCSATGSGGDATKHAASGGSSSSHQQLSADEELDEDMDDEDVDDEEEATAGCFSAKRSRSPNSCERPGQTPAGAAAADAAAAAEHVDAEEEDDKSQDDLDAAQCLQQLAMSAGNAEAQGTNHTGMPSLFDSLSNSERFAVAANRGAASNLAHWGSSGQANAALPGAAAAYAGSSSSNGSGGNAGNSSAFNQVMQAQLLNYLGALNPEGFEGFHNPRAQQQGAQAVQQKRLSLPFGSAQQQPAAQLQPQRQHHFGAVGGGLAMQRSGSLGGSWGSVAKSAPAPAAPSSGAMAAPARARKQSWFQTEIAEKIPLSVQQACAHDWAAQQCMQVVCADLCGTFYVNSAGEYLIKLAHSGEVVTPNKFEELAGKKTARNWQQSIRLVGYTMNGEPNSALLKLGHFTRIVGLVQDR